MEDQTKQEYLDEIKRKIEAMDPLGAACSSVLVHLGMIVAELINLNDWGSIEEMSAVCAEIFREAQQVHDEMPKSIH